MKRGLLFLLILMLVFLVGCGNDDTGDSDYKVHVDNSGDDAKVNIETDEGNQKIEVHGENTDEWCAEGSTWSSTGDEGSAEMVIVGIVDGGKYDGYCHVKYDIDSDETQGNIDFYFDEDGNGYQLMEVNGQTFESKWTA